MRAVVLEGYGGPEVLTSREVPDPATGPEEVLVAVTATAVNRADVLQRMGLYPGPPGEHEIPGLEFAGRVAAVGERVTAWAEGDEVMGIVGGGAYAERARPLEEKITATQRFGAEVLPRFVDGSLRPVIDSRYALEDVADAHRRMEAILNTGKLVLDVS